MTIQTSSDDEVVQLSRTLHHLDEAHRQFRGYVARHLLLSTTELAALLIVDDYPGVSPRQISHDLAITSGAVTALIDRLEDSGHVVRNVNLTDRRALHIHLTEAGLHTLEQIRQSYRHVIGPASKSIPPTPETLQLLKAIADNLDQLVASDEPLQQP